MPPSIPDRWTAYKACGNIIEGTRFICFKVPLKKAVQQGNKEIDEIWDIKSLLQKIPTLGAVIDLTNTARYYNPKDLENAGIIHKKILMPGRILPSDDKVTEFMEAVDELLGNDCVAVQVKRARAGLSTTESLIGVHCTHGLNRTGYMVCRYMRDRLGFLPDDAIKKFEEARGYSMERQVYISDLLRGNPPHTDFSINRNRRYQNMGQSWREYADSNYEGYNNNPNSNTRQRTRQRNNRFYCNSSKKFQKQQTDQSFSYRYDY